MTKLRKLLLPSIAACFALIILLNLGYWQVDRKAWKEDLIAQVEEGLAAAPVLAPGPSEWRDLDFRRDYQRVELTGHFVHGAAYYFTSLSKANGSFDGPGLMVYNPFQTTEGWLVFVNRGFLPQNLTEEQKNELSSAPTEKMKITGLLRLSEKPNWTTLKSDDLIWFSRDTEAMGQALKLEAAKLAPYSIDLEASFTPPTGLPQAGETIVQFKNDHLGYALTWFGLAATLIGVYLTYAASIIWPRTPKEQ